MTWARLDDKFHGHRKIKRAWKRSRAAIGLHVMALTYCADHMTDGFVDVEFVEEKLPKKSERDSALGALKDAGLWHESEGEAGGEGWKINDYLDFNPSADEISLQRQVKAEAGRRGGLASGRTRRLADAQAGGQAGASGVVEAKRTPDPTRPVPNTSSSSSKDEEGDREDVDQLCSLLSERVAERSGGRRRPVTKEWRAACRLLLDKDGRSVQQVRWIIEWTHNDEFWRGNVLSMPKLREQFDQLVIKAKEKHAASASLDDSFLDRLNSRGAA